MPGAHIRDEARTGYLRIGRGPVAVAERDRNGGPPSSLSPNICAVLTARSVLRRGADYLLWRAAAGLAGLRIVPGDRFPKKARRPPLGPEDHRTCRAEQPGKPAP